MKRKDRVFLVGVVLLFAAILGVSCSETRKPGTVETGPGGEKIISFGQEIKIENYLVAGKTVIFDFYSEYCPPCRLLSPRLSKLAEKRKDIVLIKVDINREGTSGIDWGSPVAQQFNLHSIPHMKIYSPEGKLDAEGDPARDRVLGMLDKEGIQ
jgi:thiol-disulfide isomerase/thioredoxin